MPTVKKFCCVPGCGRVITSGRRCPEHERIKRQQERECIDERRPSAPKRGYGHKWREARKLFLKRHPVCAICGKPSEVVDHIIPHKGDLKLFWRRSNWQPLCASCHNKKTAREVFGGKK